MDDNAPPPTCTAHHCTATTDLTVDAVNGRRCPDHAPRYLPGHALRLVDRGQAGEAFVYLRTMLAFQARRAA